MKKLLFVALAAVGLASCVQTEELAVANNKETIGFDTFVENVTKTLYDNNNLDHFNVYGTISQNGAVVTNIFPGVLVTKDSNGAWGYSSEYTQYWIPGFVYDFTAIVDGTVETGANGMPATISTNMIAQNDVLYATKNRNFVNGGQADKVSFQFAHLLSKAKFTVKNGIVNGQDFVYNVESIKIKNADKDAEYEVATGEWTATNTYEASFGEILSIGQQVSKGNETEVLLVPGTKELEIEIAYNLTYKGTELVNTTKNLTAVLTLAKGNAYNFVVEFGNPGEDIKFDAVVDTWVEGNYDVNGTSVVATVEEFTKAFASEGINNIVLADDIVLDGTTRSTVYSLIVASGRTLTLDLNGHTLSGNWHKSNGAIIKNEGTLTVVGGTISSLGENGGSAIQNSGTMIVNDATLNGAPNANGSWPSYTVNNTGNLTLNNVKVTSYHGAVASYEENAVVTLNDSEIDMRGIPGFTSHGFYTYNNGKVIVNGGNYANKATDQASTDASVINGHVEVNAGIFSGRLVAYDGTPVLKGGSYTVKPAANFVAEGYKVIENGGLFYVVPDQAETAVVANDAELKAAFDAGHTTIYMKAGIYDTKNFQVINKTILLKGIEEGVKIYNSQNNDVACTSLDMCTVTFENLTIETLGGNYKGFARMNGVYNNCTIVNNYFTCYGEHIFNNCTFNAPTLTGSFQNEHCVWTYGAAKVEFNNCVFNYSDRCVNVYVDNGGNTPGITSDITFSQCKFNTENTASEGAIEVNSSPFTAGVKVVVNGCTAPAYGKLVYVSRWDNKKGKNATILVDGELLVTPVTTAEALKEAITNGEKTIYVSGQIDLTEEILANYNGTIIGADDTACLNTRTFVVKAADEAFHLSDKTINFKNITIKVPAEDGDWLKTGFVAAGTMNFDHCVFEGQVTLNGSATWTFDDCEFGGADSGAYASFVYGAKKATFNRCSFSGVDRAAKVYGTGGVLDVEYNNCTFTSTTSNKYAVNIDASYAITKVALNGCSQTGMPGLYLVTGTKATVYVDSVQQ